MRMTSKKIFAALLLLGTLVLATGAVAYSQFGGSSSAVGAVGVSAGGDPLNPAEIPANEKAMLAASNVRADQVRPIASRGGSHFYIGTGANGKQCFIAGVARGPAPHFGIVHCPSAQPDGPTFPSATLPLLDFSSYRSGIDGETIGLTRMVGFAADSVAEVAIIDGDGNAHRARAVNNVYAREDVEQIASPRQIVAYGRSGEIIYGHSLVRDS